MRRRGIALAVSSVLHLIALATLAIAAAAPRALPAPRPRGMSAMVVPREDDSGPPGLQPLDPDDAADLRPPRGSATVSVPGFEFDAKKIESRAALLFPFLTPGLSLERFELAPHLDPRNTFHDPFAPREPAQPRGARKPPLAMSDEMIQSLVDESWSRRNRWTPFQRILQIADTHNPDAGKLAALLHEYQAQDGLQPYVDAAIRDPRMWTELGLAADHVEFIGFISRYAAEHPSTKATTELLFLLDKIAQASADALTTLLDTVPEDQLGWTRDANRAAYDFIVDIRRYYSKQLARKGLTSKEALAAYFDNVRLGILAGIVRTTPGRYRSNDARFLTGAIYWRQQDLGGALRAWREMTSEPGDYYALSIAQILSAI